jgi:hypothetical protein
MSVENKVFDLLIKQQNYYFILLRDTGGFSLNEYWRRIGDIKKTKDLDNNSVYDSFEIQHRRIQSNLSYFRSNAPDSVLLFENGITKYLYDLFAIKTKVNGVDYFVLAYPFAALAREILEKLNGLYDFRRKIDYIKVNVPLLVKRDQIPSENIITKIVGIRISIPKKNNTITSISLTGNNPLESDIYQSFLKTPVLSDEAIPKNCILAFETNSITPIPNNIIQDTFRLHSNIHIDTNGNFKFYVHVTGDNFLILHSFVQYLENMKSLETTSINPLLRFKSEEE